MRNILWNNITARQVTEMLLLAVCVGLAVSAHWTATHEVAAMRAIAPRSCVKRLACMDTWDIAVDVFRVYLTPFCFQYRQNVPCTLPAEAPDARHVT